MEYVEVKLPKCTLFLKPSEVHSLLLKDIELYKEAIARGKRIQRGNSLRERIEAKKDDSEASSRGHIH